MKKTLRFDYGALVEAIVAEMPEDPNPAPLICVNGGRRVQRLAGEKCSADGFRIEVEGGDVEGAQRLQAEEASGGFWRRGRSSRKGCGGTCEAGSPTRGVWGELPGRGTVPGP
jgi:hypothetical protein